MSEDKSNDAALQSNASQTVGKSIQARQPHRKAMQAKTETAGVTLAELTSSEVELVTLLNEEQNLRVLHNALTRFGSTLLGEHVMAGVVDLPERRAYRDRIQKLSDAVRQMIPRSTAAQSTTPPDLPPAPAGMHWIERSDRRGEWECVPNR